jgi:ferritin
MLSKKIEDALNEQINAEFYSAYLYLAMAAYFESVNLHGFAHWMKCQTKEEYDHAMKMFDFLNQCGNRVVLKNISEPPVAWDSPLAVFEATYKHEQAVTARIAALVNLAVVEKDHAAANFLQWFVKEQVEEEASAADVVQKLKMTADSTTGQLFIDSELGKRAASG